jgi:hypothetical protein
MSEQGNKSDVFSLSAFFKANREHNARNSMALKQPDKLDKSNAEAWVKSKEKYLNNGYED